jgi:hypothetical protein
MREDVYNNSQYFQEIMRNTFDRRTKEVKFQLQGLVLKWDARIEDKGKHGKFDHSWKGPYQIAKYHGKNAFILKEGNSYFLKRDPINGRFLKHYFTQS